MGYMDDIGLLGPGTGYRLGVTDGCIGETSRRQRSHPNYTDIIGGERRKRRPRKHSGGGLAAPLVFYLKEGYLQLLTLRAC